MKKSKPTSSLSLVVTLIAGIFIGSTFHENLNKFTETKESAANNAPFDTTSGSYYFTQAGDSPDRALIAAFGQAKSTLDIAIYSLTYAPIVGAILDAKKRGVTVRIISDRTEAKTQAQADALNKLKAAGIPEKINTHTGLMHLKVSIIDRAVFTTGSYNYSKAATTTNDEVLIIDRDKTAAVKWDEEFQTMWNDAKKYADYELPIEKPPGNQGGAK